MFTSIVGRSVLVTGGTKGIGKGIARVFARAGANVVVSGRDTSAGETVLRDLSGLSGSVSFVRGDVGLAPDCERIMSPSGLRRSSCSDAWFNVTSMSKNQYTLLDRASRNFLGWFDTLAEAEETRARFVEAAPQAADDLEIWDDKQGVRIEVDPETLRPAPAA